MGLQQRFHFAVQFNVADPLQEMRAFGRRNFKGLLKERLSLLPPFGDHAALLALISRCNHAFAVCHCRSIVRGETPITSAVSSTDNPLKKRSSTIRLFSGSTVSSLVNASSSASRFGSRSGAAASPSWRV